jgi:CRP-like cAMP-binding protein
MSYSRRNAKGMDEANSPVLRRLKDFQGESSRVIQVQNVESMLNRVRREIALESTEKLARVQEAFADLVHFNHISSDELENVVALLDTITFEAGKIIVDQGCLAENWFILFQGKVSVLQKQVDGDGLEKMAEALSLQPGDSFEDHAVLCGEPYTLTYRASGPVTLLSLPAAELHSLSDLDISKRSSISTAKAPDKIEEASSIHPPIPVHAILDTVPVFAPLDAAQKATVIDALVEVKFRKGAYICEEGKLGNTFYIITSGECRVTVSNKEVARLGVSDFFGEVALIERTARTATVQAVTPVWCYSLSQRNFNMYLGHLKSKLMEHSASKQLMEMAEEEDFNDVHTDRDGTTPGSDGMTAFFSAALRRRSRRNMASVASHLINIQRTRRSMVSIASNDGQETENVIAEEETQFGEVSRLGQRVRFLAKKVLSLSLSESSYGSCRSDFLDLWRTESLFLLVSCSMHVSTQIMAVHYISAFSILLDFIMMAPKDSFPEYSKIASDLLTPNLKSWNQAIDMLRNTTLSGLNHKHNRVTDAELAVISAILRVRPGWKRRYAADWPSFQWNDLIRHMKSECAASLERVYVAGSHGTKAYFILSGLVRVLAKVTNKTTGEISYVYKGHLQPGDSFGDNVLEGFHTRVHTIICVTNVVLLTVHCEDYAKVRDHGTYITVGEKFQFARTCSLIKVCMCFD